MKNRAISKSTFFTLLIYFFSVLISPNTLSACELHDGSEFGMFPHQQGYGQLPSSFASYQIFSLKHKSQIMTEVDFPSTITLKYTKPAVYKNMTIRFIVSEGITIQAANVINLENNRDEILLPFIATESGLHHIEVHINGQKNKRSYNLVRKIQVSAM